MKKLIPHDQFIVGLDKLMFAKIENTKEAAEKQREIIESYIISLGYTWDDVIDGFCSQESLSEAFKEN